ncbi:MAG: hypothetical protein A3F67_00610 [Verrucomicrobia bacterium RIFCSPHIGHO2_12_FULL_41_10]|nr:MAG: hypothetical protein A3F67_00610 [Verrucomicrobia bacterium RIFCSPHIGHO2_12_FULL_41_10]HLB34179.1 hypothetical protein [Chthoniobacterales bacterium]
MKILLTLDLYQPHSPERGFAEELIHSLWDKLQVTGNQLELLIPPPITRTLFEWSKAGASQEEVEKYRTLSPSPLESYDLIISVNLSRDAEELFTSLGKRCLIVKTVPCDGFSRFLLLRTNFPIPQEFLAELPAMKNIFLQEYPVGNVPKPERGWWLANRFLINVANRSLMCKQKRDPSFLFIGITLFQADRLQNGQILGLSTFKEELMTLLSSCPNFYYASRIPIDPEEIRFMKNLGTSIPSLPLPQLLARDELTQVISLDSGVAPVAAAFNKPFILLGNQPSWSVIRLRQFCDNNFLIACSN